MPSTEDDARRSLTRLERRLADRRPRIDRYEDYYGGRHKLTFATGKYLEAFGELLEPLSDNWTELVVDAKVERLGVDGFRFGDSEEADKEARAIWQANGMDSASTIAHRISSTCGVSYVLTAPANAKESGHEEPIMTVEHPRHAIVESSPANHRMRRAGLKVWEDEESGTSFANVFLRDSVWPFASAERRLWTPTGKVTLHLPPDRSSSNGWTALRPMANDTGVVPLVPLLNKPDERWCGRSDIAQIIPIQDAINKLFADLMVGSEFAAMPQRWAVGIGYDEDDPESKEAFDQFVANVARIWTSENEDAKFGQLDGAKIDFFVKAIEMATQHVAARSRTPPHYLLGQSGAFPSGESLKSTETGLVAKCHGTQVDAGETWEESERIAFLHKGDTTRGKDFGAETIWRDAESRTDAERADALTKYRALGFPRRTIWEKSGLVTQREIDRMMIELQEEMRMESAAAFNPFASGLPAQ